MPLEQLPLPVPHWRDLIEILLVAMVLYRVLRFLVGTRALQIVFGLLALAGIYIASLLLQLTMIPFLLGLAFTYAPFLSVAARHGPCHAGSRARAARRPQERVPRRWSS